MEATYAALQDPSKQFPNKQAKGLYFYCEDKFTLGQKCPKMPLLLIEIEENEDDVIETAEEAIAEVTPGISLHALVRELSCQTMRVRGTVS